MKKAAIFIFTIFLVIGLTACSSASGNQNALPKKMPDPIRVTLTVPDKAGVNTEVSLKALVKQGKQLVKDADEVKYEIWEDGKKDSSRMLDAKNEKNGMYTANVEFDHPGKYYVQVHVTARAMHVMPKTAISIDKG